MFCSAKYDFEFLTLTDFMIREAEKNVKVSSELVDIVSSIQVAIKTVRAAICNFNNIKISAVRETTDEVNVHGESVKILDKLSNEAFIKILSASKHIRCLISEENEHIIETPSENSNTAKYVVSFDPLDGSSNIDCLVSIGSIFCIFKPPDSTRKDQLLDSLTGKNVIAAGYALYGPATMIVLSTADGVNGFTYNPEIGEFILTQKDIVVPKKGKIYSVNEGYEASWSPAIKQYIHAKKYPLSGNRYNGRYVGSMVADVHRTLLHGGIFLYPASAQYNEGKIRFLYECLPMAHIVHNAQGRSTDGYIDTRDIIPKKLHQRSPIFLGSPDDVEELLEFIQKYDK